LQPVNLEFVQLSFRGAFGYGSDVIQIQLSGQGNVYVCGEHGSGKSSIFKLLFFILFGYAENSEGDKLKGNEIVNQDTKDFWSELRLKVDGIPYRFVHEKVGTSAMSIRIFQKKQDVSPKNQTDALKEIQRIIKVTPDIFNARVYLRQYSSPLALFGTPSERASFLSGIGGLNVYDDMSKEFTATVKSLKEHRVELERNLGQHDFIVSRLKELGSVGKDKDALKGLDHKIKGAKKRVTNLEAKVSRFHGALAEAKSLKDTQRELKELAAKHRIDPDTLDYKSVKAVLADSRKAAKKLASIEAALEDVRAIQDDMEVLEKQKPKKPAQPASAIRKLYEEEHSRARKADFEYAALEASYRKFTTLREGVCEECGTEITKAHLEKHRKEIKKKLDVAAKKVDKLLTASERFEIDLRAAEKYEAREAELKKLRAEMKRLGKASSLKAEHAATAKTYKRLTSQASVLQTALSLQKKLRAATVMDTPEKIQKVITGMEKKLSKQRSVLMTAASAQQQHESRIEEHESLTRKAKKFGKQETELKDILSRIAVYEALVYAVSIKGLKSHMLSKIDGIICDRMNTYIAGLGDLTLVPQNKSHGKLEVTRKGVGNPLNLKQLSGGQIGLLSGIVMKAFGSIMPVQCNIRILDEPAIGVSDETFADMMKSLDVLSDGCESLFIVSYRNGKFDDFDKIWRTEFREGHSKIATQ